MCMCCSSEPMCASRTARSDLLDSAGAIVAKDCSRRAELLRIQPLGPSRRRRMKRSMSARASRNATTSVLDATASRDMRTSPARTKSPARPSKAVSRTTSSIHTDSSATDRGGLRPSRMRATCVLKLRRPTRRWSRMSPIQKIMLRSAASCPRLHSPLALSSRMTSARMMIACIVCSSSGMSRRWISSMALCSE